MCMEQTPWDKCVDFHGHSCPGMAIGYRVSQEALKRLEIEPARDEELVAIVETDSCGVDAIQVLTGCTFGKGNLIYRDYGKNVFTFGIRGKEKALRISLKYGTMEKYAPEQWQALREKMFTQGVTSEEKEKLNAFRAEFIDVLLNETVENLFDIKTVEIELPHKARIFNTLQCDYCGEGVMEPRSRVREGKFACPECFQG